MCEDSLVSLHYNSEVIEYLSKEKFNKKMQKHIFPK